MSSTEQQGPPPIDELVRTEVARTIQRAIKGVQYLSAEEPLFAQTPKDTIYRRGTLELHHYRPMTDEVYRVPLVMVMSLVSKAFIFDLGPGQSLVEFLVKQGYDVYLIDWGVPRPEDRSLRLDDYVLDFLPDCASRIAADSGEQDLTMLGYCMGGQLALMYAALHHSGSLRNLICLTTPVNSEGMGLFRAWSDKRRVFRLHPAGLRAGKMEQHRGGRVCAAARREPGCASRLGVGRLLRPAADPAPHRPRFPSRG